VWVGIYHVIISLFIIGDERGRKVHNLEINVAGLEFEILSFTAGPSRV
jgi:hypothetical protein